jgi:hypothetical protein
MSDQLCVPFCPFSSPGNSHQSRLYWSGVRTRTIMDAWTKEKLAIEPRFLDHPNRSVVTVISELCWQKQDINHSRLKHDRQCAYNEQWDMFAKPLLLWKSNKCYIFCVCVCVWPYLSNLQSAYTAFYCNKDCYFSVHACVLCGRVGVRLRACSLLYPTYNAYTPYLIVICGLCGSTISFDTS